jgi:catechol 2,3-dioxygenase-like lactoylglutathione lyase family enzyme
MSYAGLSFELAVDDLQRSVDFYRDVLGLTPPPDQPLDGYIPLWGGAVTIGISLFSALPASHHLARGGPVVPRGVGAEIVLEVRDVDAAYETALRHADARGGRIEAIEDRTWGLQDFRVIDPDGYYLRITSR